jgi:integrase
MSVQLHLARVRKALKPRREPYWSAPIARGQYLGLRVIEAEKATWIARRRSDTDGRQQYRSLGWFTAEFGFDEARIAALAFFKNSAAGVSSDIVTVASACKAYITDRKGHAAARNARDSETRFERSVYDTPFGNTRLDRLRTPDIEAWRDGLKLAPASSNRTLTILKAALSLAVRSRRVDPALEREWRDVKKLAGADRRRDLFLDLAQRRALLAAATGGVRDLVEAVCLVGARAGELVSAKRGQYDGRNKTLTLSGKTGRRDIPLSTAAAALLDRLAESKLPAAPLFTRDDGKPWQHGAWAEGVRDAAVAAKLPAGVSLYTLRHAFISEALSAGLTTLDVAKLTGTSLQMIQAHYGHLAMEVVKERLAKVVMT